MKVRAVFPLLIAFAGALSPEIALARTANAAPAVPGRLEPTPLAGLSIMLAPEERRVIQSVLSGEKPPADVLQPNALGQAGPEGAPAPLPMIYLSGIYYVGPNQWTIWLNNRRIESSNPDAEFKVVDVASRGVRVEWSPRDRSEIYSFVLRPRQTFDPVARAVVEGDARRGLALKHEAAAK
jgi:hypothetical protein